MKKNAENVNIANPNEQEEKKDKKIIIIILLLIIILLIGVLGFTVVKMMNNNPTPGQTAVIEQDDETELNDADATGQIRIKINPVINVKNDTMQNLNFCNYNEGRLLQCKIKVGEDYVYDSGFLKEGEILKGDFVDMKYLKSGENEAMAEVYSYTLDEEPIGQTNVKVTLTVE